MKTFICLVVLVAIVLCCFVGCNPTEVSADDTNETICSHRWKNATCIEPATCTLCGETAGTAVGHQWAAATYESPKTCVICGKTEGSVEARRCLLCDSVIKRDGWIYCDTHACMIGNCQYPAKNVNSSWGAYCIYHSCQVPDCLGRPIGGTGYCAGHHGG